MVGFFQQLGWPKDWFDLPFQKSSIPNMTLLDFGTEHARVLLTVHFFMSSVIVKYRSIYID